MRKREKNPIVLTTVNTPHYLVSGNKRNPVKAIALTAAFFSFSLARVLLPPQNGDKPDSI